MSRRRELLRRRTQLTEIRGILESMKTLSFLETRKLGRFLAAQRAAVGCIEDMAADFLGCHPDLLPEASRRAGIVVVIGAERGFCGDLNRVLLDQVDHYVDDSLGATAQLLAIGRKLHAFVEADTRVMARIPGASVAEEITAVLDNLSDEILALQSSLGPLDVYCAHHVFDGGVEVRKLLPPFQDLPLPERRHSHPPLLYLSPPEFLAEMTDRYLFASLNAMLYESLMVESQRRIVHLGGAVQHLDEQVASLAKRGNVLRQEEIIEEIEVIMLSASGLEAPPAARRMPEPP
jgi:F-type H+-transporting ATPase subunit gamma